jgi:prophage endopeptidase
MNKYLLIALFAMAALVSCLVLKHERDGLIGSLEASNARVAQLESDATSAALALQARDALDKKQYEEMTNAKNENEGLRAQLSAGTKRLLVRANCPKQLPTVAGTTSVDDGAEPALTAVAGQDYLRLREQIIVTEAQLAGLREYIRQVVQVVK